MGTWQRRPSESQRKAQGSPSVMQETMIKNGHKSFPIKSKPKKLYREDLKAFEDSTPWPLRRPTFEHQVSSSFKHSNQAPSGLKEVHKKESSGFVDDIEAFGEFLKGFPHGVENFQIASLKDNLKTPARKRHRNKGKYSFI